VVIATLIIIGTIDSLFDSIMGLEITNTPYYDEDSLEELKIRRKLVFNVLLTFFGIGWYYYLNVKGKDCSLYGTIAILISTLSATFSVFLGSYIFNGLSGFRKRKSRLVLSILILFIVLMIIFYYEHIKNNIEM
jgi:hypothetical protein